MMLTCGTYDAAGEFVYRMGLPGKGDVGGGIIVIVPGICTLSVWSPSQELGTAQEMPRVACRARTATTAPSKSPSHRLSAPSWTPYWWTTGHPAAEVAVPTGLNQYLSPENVAAVEESVAASTRRMYGAGRQAFSA